VKQFRILIADDHDVIRHGIMSLLKAHADWEMCGEAKDGRQAVTMARELKPDVVVMDIGMPNLNGLDAAREIIRNNEDQKILILTITDTEQAIREVLKAGARGFVLKSDAAKDLVIALEAMRRGTTFFTPRVAQMILQGFLRSDAEVKTDSGTLTRREREIVQLLAEGKSTKEVATSLNLSVKTAETHRSNIMRKLKLHSISELVLFAVRNNIVVATGFDPAPLAEKQSA
jgi:DNA-binding NarL/FixJ family response regulator